MPKYVPGNFNLNHTTALLRFVEDPILTSCILPLGGDRTSVLDHHADVARFGPNSSGPKVEIHNRPRVSAGSTLGTKVTEVFQSFSSLISKQ